MSRKIRTTRKNFKVFCEGDTEYHYIDEMRRQERLSITLKPVNMKGGGYRNFLEQVKTDGNANKNSYALMLSSLKRKNCFIVNSYEVNKKQFEIEVTTIYDWDKLRNKGSNINEFFEVVNSFNT